MKKFSFSYRSLIISFFLMISLISIIAYYSVIWVSHDVEAKITEYEISTLFVSIESGPLQFARSQSAAIANTQLSYLMNESTKTDSQITEVVISSGHDFKESFARWERKYHVERPKCTETIGRIYTYESSLYPFKVMVKKDKCINFTPFVQLRNNIIIVFIIFLTIVCILVSLFFIPINRSFFLMGRFLKESPSVDLDSIGNIPFEPAREIIRIALKSKQSEKDAAIGRIIANISHDLRAPLGTFERLVNGPDNLLPSMRDSIRESLNRLHAMIESLRHTEINMLTTLKPTILDFSTFMETMEHKANLREIKIHWPLNTKEIIWVDSMKFERSWTNLLINAIESAKSEVHLEISRVKSDLYLRVIDDGEGVPAEIISNLFQRGVTFGKVGGTGLGLAYVRQVAQSHGGDASYTRSKNSTIFECFYPKAFVPKKK